MAEAILLMGKSGSGKSSSLRTLPPEETVIIKPNAKSLPFPGSEKDYVKGKNLFIIAELDYIYPALKEISDKAQHVKYVVLEDFTHTFSSRIFSKKFLARNSGGEAFQRWNDFGASVFGAIFAHIQDLRDDLTIIVIHHTEVKEDGSIGFKSAGKLLDNTIDFPSYFTYILHSVVISQNDKIQYLFQTNLDGIRHAKSPYGVFKELYIPNDMLAVIKQIERYKKGELNIKW